MSRLIRAKNVSRTCSRAYLVSSVGYEGRWCLDRYDELNYNVISAVYLSGKLVI